MDYKDDNLESVHDGRLSLIETCNLESRGHFALSCFFRYSLILGYTMLTLLLPKNDPMQGCTQRDIVC